jgi:hypothetical protein
MKITLEVNANENFIYWRWPLVAIASAVLVIIGFVAIVIF